MNVICLKCEMFCNILQLIKIKRNLPKFHCRAKRAGTKRRLSKRRLSKRRITKRR